MSDLLRDVPLDKPNYMIPMITATVVNLNALTSMTLTLVLILSMLMLLNLIKSWYQPISIVSYHRKGVKSGECYQMPIAVFCFKQTQRLPSWTVRLVQGAAFGDQEPGAHKTTDKM